MSKTSDSPNIYELIDHAKAAEALFNEMTKRQESDDSLAVRLLQESACGHFAEAMSDVFEVITNDADSHMAQAEFIAAHWECFQETRHDVVETMCEQLLAA
jgi:hypothetical protein